MLFSELLPMLYFLGLLRSYELFLIEFKLSERTVLVLVVTVPPCTCSVVLATYKSDWTVEFWATFVVSTERDPFTLFTEFEPLLEFVGVTFCDEEEPVCVVEVVVLPWTCSAMFDTSTSVLTLDFWTPCTFWTLRESLVIGVLPVLFWAFAGLAVVVPSAPLWTLFTDVLPCVCSSTPVTDVSVWIDVFWTPCAFWRLCESFRVVKPLESF